MFILRAVNVNAKKCARLTFFHFVFTLLWSLYMHILSLLDSFLFVLFHFMFLNRCIWYYKRSRYQRHLIFITWFLSLCRLFSFSNNFTFKRDISTGYLVTKKCMRSLALTALTFSALLQSIFERKAMVITGTQNSCLNTKIQIFSFKGKSLRGYYDQFPLIIWWKWSSNARTHSNVHFFDISI